MTFLKNYKGYPEVPLIEIATLKRGYDLPTQNRADGNVPIFAANGQNGSHSEAKAFGPGVVTGRSGTIGKVHYVETDYWPLNTSLYVTNFHGNHPKWVFYMLQAFKLDRFVEGAGVPTLNRNLVHGEKVPLPHLAEQKRIAAILDKADSLRRKNQQAIQLADQFLRAVFLHMFGDPVTNPKGWNIKSVVDISTRVTKGESPKWQGFDYEDHGVRFITSENVLWGQLDYRYKYISEKFNEKLFRSQLCEGDLLINLVGASVGRVCLATKESLPANINQAVSVISLNPGILLPEIALRQILTSSIQQKLLGNVVDAARANISLTNIRELELVIPPMEKQFEFLAFIKKINSAMEKQKLAKNLPLFDTLSKCIFWPNLNTHSDPI